jgi:predicted enzyme related to lactoylglutathione lyase
VRKEPEQTKAIGEGWHTDMTCFDQPPKATILFCQEVPPWGGDTQWARRYIPIVARRTRLVPLEGRCANSGDLMGRGPGGCAHTDRMPVRLHHIVVDAHDLPGLARFWTQALGWKVLSEREREIVIGTDDNAPVGICFMPVADPKTVKNRLHLDLTSSARDRDQEIERLLALGARRVDIGQTGAESWTVLADPEGNEFCVIRPKETLTR